MEKPKKERTEAQKKATASMLAKLKENRDKGISKTGRKKKEVKNILEVEVSESDSDVSEVEVKQPKVKAVVKEPVKEPVKEVVKEVPATPSYLTKDDLHAFKNEIASLLKPPTPVVQEKEVVRKQRKTVRTEVEMETPQPVVQKQKPVQGLTGYSLLDALLNR